MQRVIYGDVLAAVNFIIDLMLLSLTQRLCGVAAKRWRRYLAAGVGALCSFAIFLPGRGFVWEILLRAAATVLVIGTAYFGRPLRLLLRLSAVFFAVGFIFAGFVSAVWFLFPGELLSITNGVVYLDVSPLLLLGCVVMAYLFVGLFDRIFDGGRAASGSLSATLRRGENSVTLELFIDTGNQLVEPFSGLPVVVAGIGEVSKLLTDSERLFIITGQGLMPPGLRPVFYRGVGGDGMLYALRPDELLLQKGSRPVRCEGYLAVSTKPISCHGCAGICNPRMPGLGVAV